MPLAGDELPARRSRAAPRSRALAARLRAVESPNITRIDPVPPFWAEARGAVVRDVDDNVYVDLTAGFGVAHAGHANPAVATAISGQAARLAHGLGDVYPPEPKVDLLERLARIAPAPLAVSILGSAGAEAVEAALKTAVLRTGRTGVIAFEGGYHGLTGAALAVTHRADFRAPFAATLHRGVRFAPFPSGDDVAPTIQAIRTLMADAESGDHPIGAIIAEPMLGRGGLVVPPPPFLPALRELCDGERTLLLLDEIYTGCGRTGRWFACQYSDVVPDVLIAGKALTGSLPLSAAIGSPDAMAAWPASTGEAIHTSTFLGNPIACAAACAQLSEIERLQLHSRTMDLGTLIRERAGHWHRALQHVGPPRGLGLLQGVPVTGAGRALDVAARCLDDGVIVLAEGSHADVLAITPPAVISDAQIEHALDTIERALVDAGSA